MWFGWLLLLCGAISVSGLSSSTKSHYFTVETTLSPLEPCNDDPYTRGQHLPVVYTNHPRSVAQWLDDHVPATGEASFLGFDIEMSKRGGVPATVQLSTPDACLVVHLLRLSGCVCTACMPLLEAVLTDDAVLKAGVGVHKDLIALHQQWPADFSGRLDLLGVVGGGIRRLGKDVLGLVVADKGGVLLSRWDQVPLDQRRLAYCARDAWVGAAVTDALSTRDPAKYGASVLRKRLLQETAPFDELVEQHGIRSQAKRELARTRDDADRISLLRTIVKETRPPAPMVF